VTLDRTKRRGARIHSGLDHGTHTSITDRAGKGTRRNDEAVFRVPKQLRKAIWEACGGHDPSFD
jgi:hypothetical protein